jgi:hypothetical protein
MKTKSRAAQMILANVEGARDEALSRAKAMSEALADGGRLDWSDTRRLAVAQFTADELYRFDPHCMEDDDAMIATARETVAHLSDRLLTSACNATSGSTDIFSNALEAAKTEARGELLREFTRILNRIKT